MIDLYYWPTPNGQKVSIFLEESALPYRVIPLNLGRGDQFSKEFLAINPNHRMPAIVDTAPAGSDTPISVFESGAILMYLAEKTGQLWPQTPREKYEVVQWILWQMANQGPKLGECAHFIRAAQTADNGDQSYGLKRFDNEANRLYGVMNNRLYDRRYLAGENYSISDIACYPWAVNWAYFKQDIEEFKHVKRWLEELSARPAVQRGMSLGKELAADNDNASPEEAARRAKILYNQRAMPAPN
jgi:GSH-dependent disulfide-bond oxidoreductase